MKRDEYITRHLHLEGVAIDRERRDPDLEAMMFPIGRAMPVEDQSFAVEFKIGRTSTTLDEDACAALAAFLLKRPLVR